MDQEVNYIVFAQQGLVTFRFAMDGDEVHEFENLAEAIRFAEANDVHEMDVVFPDGDVHPIMVRPRWGPQTGHQNTPDGETP